MKLAPQAKIITNSAGKQALEAHFDTTGWEYELIKTGDSVSIGKRTLEFMTTPMLHWPDSMMTYVKEDKLLLSNDGFGQHYASDALFVKDAPLDVVTENAKSYYANILFPFGCQAEKALKTAGDLGLDIDMIAPSHGCLIRQRRGKHYSLACMPNGPPAVMKAKRSSFMTLCGVPRRQWPKRLWLFCQDAGIPVTKHCLAVKNVSEVMVDFLDAKYVLIGNPTLNNQLFPRVAGFVTYMRGLQPKNKVALAFGSYGWQSGRRQTDSTVLMSSAGKALSLLKKNYTPKSDVLEKFAERVKELIKL